MPATVTLSTTTLSEAVTSSAGRIKVASTSGLLTGTRLFVNGELMAVIRLDVDPWVNVARGVDGTASAPHASSATAYIGRADQFYTSDPVGIPAAAIPVSPHINAQNGKVWWAQGDTLPEGNANRWWQLQSETHGTGALGIRTTTLEPESST